MEKGLASPIIMPCASGFVTLKQCCLTSEINYLHKGHTVIFLNLIYSEMMLFLNMWD